MDKPFILDFVIIGGYKCGSTSFYASLNSHPKVTLSSNLEKEIDIFNDTSTYRYGPEYWQSFYESGTGKFGNGNNIYLTSMDAPRRIKAHNTNMKLLAIFRDPVVRANSQYWYEVRLGVEHRTFSDVLSEELRVVEYSGKPLQGGILDSGCYARHVERYLTYFPKKQLKVVFLEDFEASPITVINECFRFLDVEAVSNLPREYIKMNVSKIPRSKWLARIITKGLRTPTRETKKRLTGLLGRTGMIRLKRLVGVIQAINLRNNEQRGLASSDRAKLIEFYRDENRCLRAITDYLPDAWHVD